MVAGIRLSDGILVETLDSSLCGVVAAVAETEKKRLRWLRLVDLMENAPEWKNGGVWEKKDRVLWRALGVDKRGKIVVQREEKVKKLVATSSLDSVAISMEVFEGFSGFMDLLDEGGEHSSSRRVIDTWNGDEIFVFALLVRKASAFQ